MDPGEVQLSHTFSESIIATNFTYKEISLWNFFFSPYVSVASAPGAIFFSVPPAANVIHVRRGLAAAPATVEAAKLTSSCHLSYAL